MTEESALKNEICEFLELHAHKCLFTIYMRSKSKYRSRFIPAGFPDIFGIWAGRPLMIEVKTKKGVVSPEQREIMKRAQELGAICIIARSIDDVIAVLGKM